MKGVFLLGFETIYEFKMQKKILLYVIWLDF